MNPIQYGKDSLRALQKESFCLIEYTVKIYADFK